MKKLKFLTNTQVKNGVCHLMFDRKNINMNKLIVSTLEASVCVYDIFFCKFTSFNKIISVIFQHEKYV